jgi:hypothetical protein
VEDERLQKSIAWRVGCGLALVPVGLLMVLAMSGAGALSLVGQEDPSIYLLSGLGLVVVASGALLAVTGVVAGLRRVTRSDSKAAPRSVPGAYVVSTEVSNKRLEPVFDPGMYEPDELRYYARVELPGEGVREFKLAPEVYGSLGEGMRGTAMVQGDRLTGFWPDGRGAPLKYPVE